MPKVNIKQEKLEPIEAENAPNPGRKIMLKKKLVKPKVKSNDKSSLEKVKVKSFEEIMREKKIKKEKTMGVSSTAEPTPPVSTTGTTPRTHTSSSITVSKPFKHVSIPLRKLSIPLMAIPKGQHSMQTFIDSIKIKKEPVDPEEAPSVGSGSTSLPSLENSPADKTVHKVKKDIGHERQLNGTDENLFIRIKNEPSKEDINHNDTTNHDERTMHDEISTQGASDSISEPSEGSSGQLSTSVDFSDVPLGSAQDDDTMSLFAFDDTFEQEIEPEQSRKHQSGSAQRRLSKDRDLRESLQNRSKPDKADKGNVNNQSHSHTVEDRSKTDRKDDDLHTSKKENFNNKRNQNMDRRKKSRFSDNKDDSFKVPHSSSVPWVRKGFKNKFNKAKDGKNRGQLNTPFLDPNLLQNMPSIPVDEIQRLQQLHEVLSAGQPMLPLVHHIPSLLERDVVPPFGKRIDSRSFREGRKKNDGPDQLLNCKESYLNLRIPPPVPGGRGFFQDLKEPEDTNALDKTSYNKDSKEKNNWYEKDERIVALRKLSGDGLVESMETNQNKETNPTDFESSSRSKKPKNQGERYRLETTNNEETSPMDYESSSRSRKPNNKGEIYKMETTKNEEREPTDFESSSRSKKPKNKGERYRIESTLNKETSPTDIENLSRSRKPENKSERYRIPTKRRSSGNKSYDEEEDGERAAKEPKREKQVFCGTQLRLGECHYKYCRFVHLSQSELEEHKKKEISPHIESDELQRVEHSYSDEELARMKEEQETEEKEQMCKGLAEAAAQLLDSIKLGEAWQVIFHLYQMDPSKKTRLIKLLERTLVLCGEDGVDADVAAQVSAQVFDLIPKVRGNYNRHDFTTLIHCLCQTGQFIRGYEILDQMKKSDISATHEVYLDLIKSSEAKPNRAFDLIEEVKSLGLFTSSICNSLILLGSKSGRPLLEKTWLLFKEMIDNSFKPTKESFLALLDLLAGNDEGQKLLDALVLHRDPSIVPSAKCNKVIIKHSGDNADMVAINVASVCGIAKEKDPKLDVETWNVLLRNCYSEKFYLVSEAQQVYSMMKKYNIPLMTEGYNGLLCALSAGNLTILAMEVFNTLSLASGHLKIKDYKPGLDALVSALIKSKQIEELESVLTFATDNGLMVEENALLLVVAQMELEKKFEQIHQLFKKLQSTKEAIPISVFRKLVSTLEKWAENPAASLAVYAAMRRAYPIMPDPCEQKSVTDSSPPKISDSNTVNNTINPVKNQKQKLCKFFMKSGCAFGNACRFLHPTGASLPNYTPQQDDPKMANSTSPDRKNPFVLRSASFPLSGHHVQLPPPPPPPPFPNSTAASCNPLIHSPAVFAPSGPFVLKDPIPVTSFPSQPGPSVPFQMGFPKPSLFTPSFPVVASANSQTEIGMHNPGAIEPGAERHSLDLGPSVASVSTSDTRGTHSAPVVSGSHTDEGFKFPVKTEVQFYKAQIMKATEEKDLEELARLYVQMKKEEVPVNNEMLLLFYNSFITCKDIGESLSSFVAIIDIQLDNLDADEDCSPKEALDADDHKFIGELGVALMQLCRTCKRLDEGYLVLHVLHQYGVNYFQYPASFVPNAKVLSPQIIALLATDMCLCLEKDPQFDGAVEVLRGCNYAIPIDGGIPTIEEAEKRRLTFEKLATHYLSVGNYVVVYELLQHVGDKDMFGMTSLKSIYNELLKKYIADKKVDDAIGVIREMESELISRDPNVLRALVTCLGNIGRFVQANEIFKSSCLQGAYPSFPSGDELWKATVWISFSKFEIQFYLEQHLQLLNKYVEQHRIASQMPYDDGHFKPLRIIIAREEENRSGNNMAIDVAKQMQEKIIGILCSDFNPPLSCGMSDKIGEVIVNPRSLRRWFLANPPPELQTSPYSGSDSSAEQQRNVMTSRGQPGITIRLENPHHSDTLRNSLNDTFEKRVKHTVCGHLTRFLRQGLFNKEEFRRLARELTQEFLQSLNMADLNRDYKQVRPRVVTFVDRFFEMRRTEPNNVLFRNQEL